MNTSARHGPMHGVRVLDKCRFPVKFGISPATIRRLAPNLGEHTQEVLDEVASRKRQRTAGFAPTRRSVKE